MQKLNFKNICLSVFFLMSGIGSVSAQDLQLLQKADSLFEKRRYTQSLELFQQVLGSGKHSPAMLLKMSFISEGLERPEEALLYLNLYYMKTGDERVATKIKELAEENNLSGYEVSGNEILGLMIYRKIPVILPIVAGLSALLIALMFYQRKKLGTRPVIPGLFLLFIIAGSLFVSNYTTRIEYAIISDTSTPIMSGPSPASDLITMAKAGHKVRVLGKEDIWLKILWNDKIAYIKESHLRALSEFI